MSHGTNGLITTVAAPGAVHIKGQGPIDFDEGLSWPSGGWAKSWQFGHHHVMQASWLHNQDSTGRAACVPALAQRAH